MRFSSRRGDVGVECLYRKGDRGDKILGYAFFSVGERDCLKVLCSRFSFLIYYYGAGLGIFDGYNRFLCLGRLLLVSRVFNILRYLVGGFSLIICIVL